MISWIQRTFQHHFRTVFAVVLGIMIVSFIISYGASPGVGHGDHRTYSQKFFGHDLGSAADVGQMQEEAQLSLILTSGYNNLDDKQFDNYNHRRVAMLYLADQLHLPPASPADIQAYIEELPRFAGANGQFDPSRYEAFRNGLQAQPALAARVAAVIAQDARIEAAQNLLVGPGFVCPEDVRQSVIGDDTQWTVSTATVSYAGFHPEIEPSELDLANFYNQNSQRYQIPPRVEVSYVDFPAERYTGSVGATDAHKLDKAKQLAAKDASDISYALYEDKIAQGAGLDGFLAAHKLELKPLAPFTQDKGPAEFGGSPEIAAAAFQLASDHYYSDALNTPSGAIILIYRGTEPARIPDLSEVRSQVLADYRTNERVRRFAAVGAELRDAIQARLKAGKTFAAATAAAAASLSIEATAKDLPPFTLRSRPQNIDPTIGRALGGLQKGAISSFIVSAQQGVLVYAEDKKLPTVTEADPSYAGTRGEFAYLASKVAFGGYLDDLIARELARTAPKAN